jgi:putative tryptophan/tyrosine transport system substrate-binding protein
MASHIGRRKFLATLGGAAATWPVAARAQQQPPTAVIGYLSARSPDDTWHLVEAFRRGLREAGFVEGQNATIEYRWALGEQERLASDLVRKPVSVLVATGGESAALAAKAATSTIPIAFIIGGDPVKLGLAASYSRPGANATGISILTATLEPKRLELLRELVPQASTIGAFLDPNFPPYEDQLRDLREAARTLDLQVHELRVSTDAEIDLAFKTVAQQRIGAIMVTAGPFFDTRLREIPKGARRSKADGTRSTAGPRSQRASASTPPSSSLVHGKRHALEAQDVDHRCVIVLLGCALQPTEIVDCPDDGGEQK